MRRLTLTLAIAAAGLAAAPGAGARPLVPNVAPPPCLGSGMTSAVNSGAYLPNVAHLASPPGSMTWNWQTGATESVTSVNLTLFNSGVKSSGASYSFTFWGAGLYTYDSTVDSSQKGTVTVAPCSTQAKPTHGSPVYIEVQRAHHPHWVEDVEIKKPGSSAWVWLKQGVVTPQVSFTPTVAGTYQFRARMRRTTTGRFSGFSPPFVLKVK
jgi:plastocyanin